MKIFIGFGYNTNDKWIKDLVFPLVEAFDVKIITGEDMYGDILSEEVEKRIKEVDGMLAFLTRRDEMVSGKFTTHKWVCDELMIANTSNIPAVEVRDKLIDTQQGASGDRQRIEFSLDKKEELLVELSKLISMWKRRIKSRRFCLMPMEIIQDVRPLIRTNEIKCLYKFRTGNKETNEYETKPFKIGQGLCVDINNIPSDDSMVEVRLCGPSFEWSSDFESVELLRINLLKN